MRLFLDATSITAWLRCREEWRLSYLEQRTGQYIAIHRSSGIAVHKGIEALWRGKTFAEAQAVMLDYFSSVPDNRIASTDQKKWGELREMAPEQLAVYCDNTEIKPGCSLEHEFQRILFEQDGWTVSAVGRMDRVENSCGQRDSTAASRNPLAGLAASHSPEDMPHQGQPRASVSAGVRLVDIKTASEIDGYDEFNKKVGWERSYRAQMCKDVGLGLYDWYLRQIGLVPSAVVLEIITKPNERYGKKCRLVKMEMPEVIAYRERFDALLELTAREILHYVRHYREMKPWPMSVTACARGEGIEGNTAKYGNCPMLALCNLGSNPRTEKLYTIREEHLSIEKRIEI